ncbi:MAG: hypothetical protein HC822_05300 [Oscillochloris sp.]|nr:hypothetical protein [Oscillochloris sp.]
MSEPLLLTKLFPPPLRPLLVARDRLQVRLGLQRAQSVTLVVAQAGAGKTTLIAQALARPDSPSAAWLALDERDNDPARFWRYLLAALRQVDPNLLAEADAWLDAAPAVSPAHWRRRC